MAADGVIEYYKEQLEHGRHIEVQRSTVAGIAATISGAIIGELLKRPKLSREDLPYTVALTFVGLIALVLSAKLYERFRLHNEIAKLARNNLNPQLAEFRKEAQRTIKAKYPFLFWLKLHVIWNLLFASISVIDQRNRPRYNRARLVLNGGCYGLAENLARDYPPLVTDPVAL